MTLSSDNKDISMTINVLINKLCKIFNGKNLLEISGSNVLGLNWRLGNFLGAFTKHLDFLWGLGGADLFDPITHMNKQIYRLNFNFPHFQFPGNLMNI